MTSALAECDRLSAARWMPPEAPISVYDFSKTIILHDGPLAGTYLNPPAERAVELWLQMLASRKYRWHLQVAPSQRSKTLTGVLIPTLHALIEERVNVGWIMPNLDKLAQKWEGSIKPMIEGGGYGAYLPTSGPASKGGRPAALTFRSPETAARLATLYAMALGKGGSETSTASNPCARLMIDEADDAANAGQIRLAQKRTASYGAAGGGIIVSTVNERAGRDAHPILELYPDGTQTRLAHLCPHCNVHVIPDLEHFNVERAAIACPSCGALWSEADRHAARNAAVYQHKNPNAEEFSVLYVAIDYFWEYPDQRTGVVELLLPALAREHKTALAAKERGDPSQWDTYLRKCWCRGETADDSEVPATIDVHLAARCVQSPHERAEIPGSSAVVTVGCDTGKRDAWWLGLSMSADLSWHIVDWSVKTTGDHHAEPSPVQQRDMLNNLDERKSRLGRVNAMGVDVGYNTDLVVKWARSHGYKCIRGDPRPSGRKEEADNKNLPSWAEARKQDDGSTWLFLDVAVIKTEIAKALARDPNTPGSGHLPKGQEAGDWLINHLTAEVWDSKFKTWVKRTIKIHGPGGQGKKNHLLDCLVYAWALAMIELMRVRTAGPPVNKDIDHDDFGSAVW